MECVHVVCVQLTLPCRFILCSRVEQESREIKQAKFSVALTGLLMIFQIRFFKGSLDMCN